MAALQESYKYGTKILCIHYISIMLEIKHVLELHIRQGLSFEVSTQGQIKQSSGSGPGVIHHPEYMLASNG